MNREGGLELLDRFVSIAVLNRLQRFVEEVNRLLRLVSGNYALRNRLAGFKAQVNLNAVDLPHAAHVTARAAVCDVHFLGSRLIPVTSINPHREAATTELAKEKRAVAVRRRRRFTSAAGEPHYHRVIQSLTVGCNDVALNSVPA